MSTDTELDASVRRVLLGILADGDPYTGIPLVDPTTSLLAPPIVDAIRAPIADALTELDADVSTLGGTVAGQGVELEAAAAAIEALPNTIDSVAVSRRTSDTQRPFASAARTTNGAQAVGLYEPDGTVFYISPGLHTSTDHGVTMSADHGLPAGVTVAGVRKVIRAGGYIWLGAIDTSDGRTRIWRAPVVSGTYVWSAALHTMTYLGGLLSCGMDADANYVYVGDYADPSGGAHVWRIGVASGTVQDVTPAGITRHVHAITPDPYNAGHVWMSTGDSGARLYRSTDYGATWTLIDSQWQCVQLSFTPTHVWLALDAADATVAVLDRDTLAIRSACPTFHYNIPVPGGAPSRSGADLATTSGSATVTSATAAFTAADRGREIIHSRTTNLANYIASVTNSTTAVLATTSWGTASGLAWTIFGDRFYARAFFGAVDPDTGIYYCIANDQSANGSRSGLFMLPGIGEPLQLVQAFNEAIIGALFIDGGYIHAHMIVRPVIAFD